MRLIKMFSLAMLTVVAAMAVIGASSASAQHKLLGSVICHLGATAGLCPAGQLPYTGPFLGTSLGKHTVVSGFTTRLCDVHVEGSITNAGGLETHPFGTITAVTSTNCAVDNNPCALVFSTVKSVSAAAENLPWHFTVLGTSTLSLGQIHISNVKESFTIVCNSGTTLKCIYGASTVLPDTLNHTSTLTTQIHADKLPLTREAGSSFGCSETVTLTALYDLTQNLSIHLL